MKTLLLLLSTLIISHLTGQNLNSSTYSNRNLLKVNDQYFQSNLNGLGQLMAHLDHTESLSYQYLEKEYHDLVRSNKRGYTLLGGGVIGGTLIMALGVTSPDHIVTSSIIGSIVILTSTFIALPELVFQDDILSFINRYNAFSKKYKIQITWNNSVESFQGLAGGLSLKVNF